MVVIVKFVGLMIMAVGLAIFASPQFSSKLFDLFKEGKRIYYAGVFRSVVGFVLLIASSQSPVPLAAMALGLMFLVSALVVFTADGEKLKSFIAAYSEMPALFIRLLGLAAASFGILIFSLF